MPLDLLSWRKDGKKVVLLDVPFHCQVRLSLTSTHLAADKSGKTALLWVFIRHYKWDLLAGVLPRLAYVGFTFAEPFLVKRVLDFTVEPDGPNTRNFGYGLIGAYALVHIGKAVRCSSYPFVSPLIV